MLILVKSMFLKCFFAYIIMRKSIDPTYITNTLSYIHLLPLNEQTEHFKINCSNTRLYNFIKKATNHIN